MAMYPNADWGKLLRDAIPGIFERDKDALALVTKINGDLDACGYTPQDVDDMCAGTSFQKKWQEVNIPIKVNGVARENKVGPSGCDSCHYVLGHQIEIEKFRLTWTTWTVENRTIKINSSYDFSMEKDDLVLVGGFWTLFACGYEQDPHGDYAGELLTELGETKKLFK